MVERDDNPRSARRTRRRRRPRDRPGRETVEKPAKAEHRAEKKAEKPSDEARAEQILRDVDSLGRDLLKTLRDLAPESVVRELSVALSVSLTGGAPSRRRVDNLVTDLRRRIEERVVAEAAFARDRVYCLRCERSDCSHSVPQGPRSVFSGYEETGRGEWTEFEVLLSMRGDARLERLYSDRRPLIGVVMNHDEIYQRLLPAFAATVDRYRVLAQLVLGLFTPVRGSPGEPQAVTVQVVRSGSHHDDAVLGLNVLGSMGWVTRRLEGALTPLRQEIGSYRGRRLPHSGIALQRLNQKMFALLRDAARDLEHGSRLAPARTQHAQERSRDGGRPTAKAFDDARRVLDECLWEDRQEGTVVVLGPRGRVHVFSPEARHVTSAVYPGHVIKARTTRKRWVPLSEEQCRAFRDKLRDLQRS